ncbi:MAG: TauD/TfdA family dioxygenase [Deltaproteobacteria bacterium]|nr:TauD/TfdA family dioxygenase [Deltaproteobacteria bacterium]MBW2495679.1 TauD/TfdA family dioxygenase [Deltaproteobacteria bacterium]
MALRFEHFEAKLASPCLGAEISGIDLAQPLTPALAKELEKALLEFKVLFFRDQAIGPKEHAAFARHFGALEIHPFLPAGETPEVIRFSKDAEVVGVENVWHSDVSWREEPSLGSVLRALEVPEVGGDTLWADMEAVYEGLPDDLKERIEGLRAVHDFVHTFGMALDDAERARKREEFPPASHPVVRTHPATGRRCVYVNPIFTSHIEGMDAEESDALLERLYAETEVPEYQVRFHWRAGSIAFWDNRSTQHLAASDYWPQKRVMERLTIVGDQPV